MIGRAISGRSIGKALQQAANHVRAQQVECKEDLQKLDTSSNELVDRRGNTLLELAEHYLPDVSQDTILASFRGVRDRLLDVLQRKQARERQLHDELNRDAAESKRMEAQLDQVTDQLNEKVEERERLEAIVAERLSHDDDFQVLSHQALAAEQELERNEERIAEIKQEASEKLPAYNKNKLFRYLFDRGYGTSDYKKKGLTKQLDKWIAKLVKYSRSKRSYDFLRVTPELMAAEVARRHDQFNALMEKIEAIEDRISDEVGLTQVLREGNDLGTQRDQLVAELAQLERNYNKNQEELTSLAGKQNEFYEQALAEMKRFLSEMKHSWLEYQSRGTPEREDDQLVAEIGWLNGQLDNAREQAGQVVREQRSWDERAEGLQDLIHRFRRSDYDSRRSIFSAEFDVERYLGSYLRGEIGREELWSAVRRYQHFEHGQFEQPGWGVDDSWDYDNLPGVLGRVLIEVAGEAMKHAVRRGMQRRWPQRQDYRQKSGKPNIEWRWFTDGKGF